MNKYIIVIHGGAGKLFTNLKPEKREEYQQCLQNALNEGLNILKNGKTAVDAVEAAVMALEDCKLFNAGRGSVFNCQGKHEMEAAIMDGKNLDCGAVSCVKRFKNPVSVAKLVMQYSPHVYMVGKGAEIFTKEMEDHHGIVIERREPEWFYVETRYKQWQEALKTESIALDHDINVDEDDNGENNNNNNNNKNDNDTQQNQQINNNSNNNKNDNNNNKNNKNDNEHKNDKYQNENVNNINISDNSIKFGTVGAVALDIHGNVAAATSTGGLTNKKIGRVGDTPLIGCGTYANNNSCAVSCTGHGEMFIRHVTAHSVSALMEFGGMSLKEAVDTVLKKRLPLDAGGLIAVAPNGEVEMSYNSEGMFCGVADAEGRYEIKLNS